MKNDILRYIRYCAIIILIQIFLLYALTILFINSSSNKIIKEIQKIELKQEFKDRQL